MFITVISKARHYILFYTSYTQFTFYTSGFQPVVTGLQGARECSIGIRELFSISCLRRLQPKSYFKDVVLLAACYKETLSYALLFSGITSTPYGNNGEL
jgi:hypothetical protein